MFFNPALGRAVLRSCFCFFLTAAIRENGRIESADDTTEIRGFEHLACGVNIFSFFFLFFLFRVFYYHDLCISPPSIPVSSIIGPF
jgi:hypothetical protein